MGRMYTCWVVQFDEVLLGSVFRVYCSATLCCAFCVLAAVACFSHKGSTTLWLTAACVADILQQH